MYLNEEQDLLNEDFRKQVIEEIEGDENKKRKAAMKKRYDIYKDYTKEYVLQMMINESVDEKIAKEIINRIANISFCKKIIEKKAMVYKDGVTREVLDSSEDSQSQIDKIVDLVNLNNVMKKVNKYEELFKNSLVQILPYRNPNTGKYYYRPTVLAPYLYDVIEDQQNPEIPRVYIYSYYKDDTDGMSYAPEHMSGYREFDGKQIIGKSFRQGDNRDQVIADSPDDKGADKKEYIWWSGLYHFTTDCKGNIIPGKQEDDLLNPIGQLPQYNFSQDQDGQFWSLGGEDIIDGSILLNVLLTDLFYIAKYQGMGIGYLFGKGVPKNLKVGASSFVTLEVEDGDPTPSIGFATSAPPINAHLDMIEKYVALLLSTNNLEPGSISGNLSATSASSGIQEMIKHAENMSDIQNQRELYRDGEPVIFKIMAKWHNLYLDRGELDEEFAELGKIDEDLFVRVKFADPQPFITEKEKIEIIKSRLDVGIDSMIDAIMKDNPELTEEEAEEKLKKIMEEKLQRNTEKLRMFNPLMDKNEEKKEEVEDEVEEDIEEEDLGKQDNI